MTAPPVKPRRSVVTRAGRPSATATRAGTGCRQRRTAETSGWWLVAGDWWLVAAGGSAQSNAPFAWFDALALNARVEAVEERVSRVLPFDKLTAPRACREVRGSS